jgi:hypothetical protein
MARPITLHIETGPGGWLKAFWRRNPDDTDNVIFCRFRPPRSKRHAWTLVGLYASKDSRPPWLSTELLDDVPRHRIEVAVAASVDVFQKGLLEDLDVEVDPDDLDGEFERVYSTAPRPKLERPHRGELGDDFFREVAMAYRFALAGGHAPLETLSADSGIPRGTIARWVATARERGFLPPTTPGRVSS